MDVSLLILNIKVFANAIWKDFQFAIICYAYFESLIKREVLR